MRTNPSTAPLVRGNLLPGSPIGATVAHRAEQVAGLMLQRRKVALAYKRLPSEDLRIALEHVDRDLAQHHIDIPAILRLSKRH